MCVPDEEAYPRGVDSLCITKLRAGLTKYHIFFLCADLFVLHFLGSLSETGTICRSHPFPPRDPCLEKWILVFSTVALETHIKHKRRGI